jgi:hypothetical protein
MRIRVWQLVVAGALLLTPGFAFGHEVACTAEGEHAVRCNGVLYTAQPARRLLQSGTQAKESKKNTGRGVKEEQKEVEAEDTYLVPRPGTYICLNTTECEEEKALEFALG